MTTHDAIDIPKNATFRDNLAPALDRNASVFDGAAGVLVLLLAILGLLGVAPRTMTALSCLGAGLAVAFEAAGVTRRYRRMLSSHGKSESSEIRGAMIAQVSGGIVAFLLGILALIGIEPLAFPAIASLVVGASLFLGTGAEIEVHSVATSLEPSETRRVIHQAVIAAGGARLLVAVASITLGILAFAGISPLTLLLTTSLLFGVALLLGSVSVGDGMPAREYSDGPTL
ncbi:MAG TPA: hypothetical protein VMS65_10465 [Polyangiaceae bacterium]|nr:hypothetical protein [Polyangiaceae bacterium]